MTSSTTLVIPRAFNWLLPLLGPVAGVAIYASIYVFGVGTIPFILTIVGVSGRSSLERESTTD